MGCIHNGIYFYHNNWKDTAKGASGHMVVSCEYNDKMPNVISVVFLECIVLESPLVKVPLTLPGFQHRKSSEEEFKSGRQREHPPHFSFLLKEDELNLQKLLYHLIQSGPQIGLWFSLIG